MLRDLAPEEEVLIRQLVVKAVKESIDRLPTRTLVSVWSVLRSYEQLSEVCPPPLRLHRP